MLARCVSPPMDFLKNLEGRATIRIVCDVFARVQSLFLTTYCRRGTSPTAAILSVASTKGKIWYLRSQCGAAILKFSSTPSIWSWENSPTPFIRLHQTKFLKHSRSREGFTGSSDTQVWWKPFRSVAMGTLYEKVMKAFTNASVWFWTAEIAKKKKKDINFLVKDLFTAT